MQRTRQRKVHCMWDEHERFAKAVIRLLSWAMLVLAVA